MPVVDWVRIAMSALVTLALCATHAGAHEYPTRPIRALVGFVAGGGTDLMAREIGQKLSASLGQQVIVDNRAGGGGVIAAVIARDAPPDGHTIFFGTISTLAANVATMSRLPYDPVRDYAPITMTSSTPYFLVVHPSVPAHSVKEFIALAKAKPGQLNFGSTGIGGGSHLALELFRTMAGLDMVHIPYKGGAQLMSEILAGHIQMSYSVPTVALTHARSGKIRILAVSSAKRLSVWPDAPAIAEAGVPGYEATSWQGVVAPARTPRPILTRLHGEIVKALHAPELAGRLKADGAEIGGMPPEEFGRLIRTEIAKWVKVVKQAQIKVE
jgi:tripartite-type tricarboxylate transporter receptor subunit TctC